MSGGPDSQCPWKGTLTHTSSLSNSGFLHCLGQNGDPGEDHIISQNLRILLLIDEDGIKFVNRIVENHFTLDVWAEPV